MLPEQPISFPEFVADQLLTASNLNDLFHYLDVQERGTRSNLIGIGIVCGLEVSINSAGTSLRISKGCGITTQGYLVRWDDTVFENYKPYDAAKELVYPPFYGSGAQKFPIDELKSNSSEEGITKLTKAYLEDKVTLLFVELLEVEAKNCDPESCDDKGKSVTLTIRPLLVKKSDAVYLTGGAAGTNSFNQGWMSLPELKMPRHHVPAGDIFDSGDVFEGFQKVLNATFLKKVEQQLSQTYKRLLPLVKDLYDANPFAGLAEGFAFIYNGTMTAQQLLYLQYYYDLFGDVTSAYEELRRAGMKLLSMCCPDEQLFPRHLLLGITGTGVNTIRPDFRHAFIPSPAIGCHGDLVGELRVLFRRLVLLLQRFSLQIAQEVPVFSTLNEAAMLSRISSTNRPIRITPSRHGAIPLSEKSIPFYYNVASGADKLYQHWNFSRSRNGSAEQILSYHASDYNNSDDDVLQPLHYDLEPYNFLRIEGHVGHPYVDALAAINQIRDTNRLPFDVVALSADIITLREQLASIANSTNYANLREGATTDIFLQCHFQDLEALYDTMAQGLLCNLCKEMKYYYNQPRTADGVADQVPAAPLLKKYDPTFRYRPDSIGDQFEQFYKASGRAPYSSPDQFSGNILSNSLLANERSAMSMLLLLLYYIEKLSEVLPTTLISFNIVAFQRRYTDLMQVAQRIKDLYDQSSSNDATDTLHEDLIDHLDALLYACKDAQFLALYNDYKVRWVYLAMLQKLGYYVKMHPGIQHKAGVPMGGTFILVYHEVSRARRPDTSIFNRDRAVAATETERAAEPMLTEQPRIAKAMIQSREEAPTEEAAEGTHERQAGSVKMSAAAFTTVHQLQISKLKAQLTQKQLGIIDRLFFKDIITRNSLDELTAQLPDKIVIADFYLPYMCCSDCPPVYYIVNEPDEETDQPTISIKDLQYCGGDKAAYPITVSPAGGSFNNSEGVVEANGVFTFNPSVVAVPEDALNKIVQLVYTRDGLSASVNVTVFAKPTADFEALPATTFTLFVFNNTSRNAASIAWDFGDSLTGTGNQVTHNYGQEGTYTVTLKATNGICSDTITKTITITKATLSLDSVSFCSADKAAYAIHATPQGGTITGEGTAQSANGPVFSPSGIAFAAGQASKDIVISYSVSGQLVQATVKVFQTPSAVFTVQTGTAAPNIRAFQTANNFPVQYSWDFGDGGSSVEANPSHQYKTGGSFKVTLNATNGPCSATSSQNITIKTDQPATKNCGPLADVLASFKGLSDINPDMFASFVKSYKSYPGIEDYIGKLAAIVSTTATEQIKYFIETQVAARLLQWFTELNTLVPNSEVRQTAIAMWQVLTDLAMYIQCIQDNDFEKNQIDLSDLFNRLEGFIKSWAGLVSKFSPADIDQLKLLLKDMMAERDRVSGNGEAAIKKNYLSKLASIISMLNAYVK